MHVEFHNYDREETDVEVIQDTSSKSTLHIGISNDDAAESIKIYMREEEIVGFIEKLSKALDKYKNCYTRRNPNESE